MTSPNTPDPQTLALIAAQLNPKLACDNPAKAIELARNLLIAADPELAKQAADQALEIQLQKESEGHDELFPLNERIPVAEAFKALPGQYKTEQGFTDALRKENLTRKDQDVNLPGWLKASPGERDKFVQYREVTSLKAVHELFRRQREAENAFDRKRKAQSKEKKQKTAPEKKDQKPELKDQKPEQNPKKPERNPQKAEASERG